MVVLGGPSHPGPRPQGLGYLNPADAGYENLVLDPRGSAFRREDGAVVHVIIESAAAKDVLNPIRISGHDSSGGIGDLLTAERPPFDRQAVRPDRNTGRNTGRVARNQRNIGNGVVLSDYVASIYGRAGYGP